MSNLVGVQTQWDSAEMLRYLELVGPKWCMGINVLKRAYLEKVRDRGAKYIYRHHPNFDEVPGLTRWMDDPEQAAEDATDFLALRLQDVLDLVDRVIEGNEYILGPDHETSERIALADRFMAAFIPLARSKLGMGSVVGNFNTGHWRKEGELVEYFPRTLQALQEDCEAYPENGSLLGLHEYNWKLLRDDTYWRTATFLRAMPPIVEQFPLVRCLITELGIDRAAAEWQAPHEGFRKTHPDSNVAIEMFCGGDGLAWYVDRMMEAAAYVEGCLLFGCGMGDWRTMGFDVMNSPDDTAVPERISLLPDAAPPEPPEPPEEDPMDIKIFDYDAVPRDWDWLRAEFGDVRVHPVEEKFSVREGERIYKVCYLRAKTGNSACQINVKDLDGQNIVRETVVFGWADAEPHGLIDNGHNWTGNGVPGRTNETGDVGPGMGAFYSPADGERGPYWCWVYGLPSDYVDGLGMLAVTNHSHVDVGYEEVIAGEGEPPEPPENGILDEILAAVEATKADTSEILHILGTPPELPPEDAPYWAQYYANKELSGPSALERHEDTILHDWGSGSPPGVPSDNFSARWTSNRWFDAGTWIFHFRGDDGMRLWVDGISVFNQWHDQSPTSYEVEVILSEGLHDLEMHFYERGGGAVCAMWYEKG